eukprot:1151268-Pelagomonas_calceolata.AAC.2
MAHTMKHACDETPPPHQRICLPAQTRAGKRSRLALAWGGLPVGANTCSESVAGLRWRGGVCLPAQTRAAKA